MGCASSQPSFITSPNGSLEDYQKRYLETKTLGEGEFGVVKLAHDATEKDLIHSKPLAVKYLKKGYQFKDNTIYTPIKKEVLVGEVEILRRLNGECYNLKLISVYETPSLILVVTEYCEGGEMIPYVTNAFGSSSNEDGGLRTEDVSRMSYQLFSAVNHCAKHGVIHRDIKPQNVMFCTKERDSELRLIDYGSGTLDDRANPQESDVEQHHTFAGSAFYISPEMFQRIYTSKTDVWSAAVTLYVLVAGYPAERLQECFNILQSDKPNRLRNLPNIPDNMPDSFYAMLEGALTYIPKHRSNAGQLLQGEFAQFHKHHDENPVPVEDEDDVVEESADDLPPRRSLARTQSVLLKGAVDRHSLFLGYQSFERSLTTLLATMLPKDQCKILVTTLRSHHLSRPEEANENVVSDTAKEEKTDHIALNQGGVKQTNASKLQVIPIKELITVVQDLNTKESMNVVKQIQSMAAYTYYETHAYHIAMLRQFVNLSSNRNKGNLDCSQSSVKSIGVNSVHGGNVWSTFKSTRKMSVRAGNSSTRNLDDSGSRRGVDLSARSQPGMRMRRINTATGALSSL